MSLDHFETSGQIEQGRLKVRHQSHFEQQIRQMRDGEVIVSVRHARATRSAASNRLYWRFYVSPLAEYTGYSPLWVHQYLKSRFLIAPQIVIAGPDGEVIDEASIEPTTTTLSKADFSAYLDNISDFAATLNVTVGIPIEDRAYSYE